MLFTTTGAANTNAEQPVRDHQQQSSAMERLQFSKPAQRHTPTKGDRYSFDLL